METNRILLRARAAAVVRNPFSSRKLKKNSKKKSMYMKKMLMSKRLNLTSESRMVISFISIT